MRPTRRDLFVFGVAVLVPLAIALAFGHPSDRVLIPASLMLATVVAVTFAGGAVAGIVAALTSTAALWFFNLPPGWTFLLDSAEDIVSVLVMGAVSVALALFIEWMQRRERAATIRTTELEEARRIDRQTIDTLQLALLPVTPPTVPGLSIGCAYTVGGGPSSPVGGDWFSVIPMADGRLGVAIGDVVGHGIEAVAAMAEYRFTLRALAAAGEDPHVVLNQLSQLSGRFGRTAAYTTCVYGVLDPTAATWRFANAGHPPPLRVRDGVVELLEAAGRPPVGALRHSRDRYESAEHVLKVGDLIAFYTDGLVERRGELIDLGIHRLGERAARASGDMIDLSESSREIIIDLVGDGPPDDAALVLVHFDSAIS